MSRELTRKQLADYAREGDHLGPFYDPTGHSDDQVIARAVRDFGGWDAFVEAAQRDLNR